MEQGNKDSAFSNVTCSKIAATSELWSVDGFEFVANTTIYKAPNSPLQERELDSFSICFGSAPSFWPAWLEGLVPESSGVLHVDMNGISSLVYNRNTAVDDELLRSLVQEFGLLAGGKYFRLGVSGLPGTADRGPADVAELALLNGKTGDIEVLSKAGFLRAGEDFADVASIDKLQPENPNRRFAYSQTSFVPLNDSLEATSHQDRFLKIRVDKKTSLLRVLADLADNNNLNAFSCAITLRGEGIGNSLVIGRVAATGKPAKWSSLDDASSAGVIQEFLLESDQTCVAVGARLQRSEPDWENLAGKQYQSDGHFHAFIEPTPGKALQHSGFHLRDIKLEIGSTFSIDLYPISKRIRIHPLESSGSESVCASSGRSIIELAGLG